EKGAVGRRRARSEGATGTASTLRLAGGIYRSAPTADCLQFGAASAGALRIRRLNFVDAQFAGARSVCIMKTSTFRIVPLPTEVAEEARNVAESGAADHALLKVDSPTGYSCRHCLRWAQPGERVILFPYTSIPAGHPFSETGPSSCHAESCKRSQATCEYPADFLNARVLRA